MSSHPATWSNRALDNYQRARSGPVKITWPDGTTDTVSAWALEVERRKRRHARARRKKAYKQT